MGGRGATYKNYSGQMNIQVDDTLSEDSETEKQTAIVKQLKKRNVLVMASTDNISDEILTPQLKTINKILSKTKLYPFMEDKKLMIRTEKMGNHRIQACFKCDEKDFNHPQLIYNKSINNKTAEHIENSVKENIKARHWSKSDPQNYIAHTTAHEMGHLVQRILTEKHAEKNAERGKRLLRGRVYGTIIAYRMKADILRIAKEELHSSQEKISTYGESSPYEFFAETYAELICSTKPTPLAQALEIYLRRI